MRPLTTGHAAWAEGHAGRACVVVGQKARSSFRVVLARRGDRIAATLGPWVVEWVIFSAIVGPLLFGHAAGLQGTTCRPAITVGDKLGGGDSLGLPCRSEQKQSLKGEQNKNVSWCHGLHELIWFTSEVAFAIPTRSNHSYGHLMTLYTASGDLDHSDKRTLEIIRQRNINS